MGQPDTIGSVRVATTGKNAELVKTVPVRGSAGRREVVMMLDQRGAEQASLPDLVPGDGLRVSAEVEVTTDCEKPQSDCVRKPYDFAPHVEARLLLADHPKASEADSGHSVVLDTQRRKVTHARHHDVFVFDEVSFVVAAEGLPWTGPSFVNVAIGAHHDEARDGHAILIGQNEAGHVLGDMSGISMIRSRPANLPEPDPLREIRRRAESIPVIKGETRVVYARELKNLTRGEQLVVKAEVETSTEHLDYPARVTLEVLLAEDPRRAEPGAEARRITASDGRICPRNGKNCQAAESPMLSTKAGVVSIEKNARKPMYVIVVLATGDPLQRAKSGDELRIRDSGSLRIFRYPAEMGENGRGAGGEG